MVYREVKARNEELETWKYCGRLTQDEIKKLDYQQIICSSNCYDEYGNFCGSNAVFIFSFKDELETFFKKNYPTDVVVNFADDFQVVFKDLMEKETPEFFLFKHPRLLSFSLVNGSPIQSEIGIAVLNNTQYPQIIKNLLECKPKRAIASSIDFIISNFSQLVKIVNKPELITAILLPFFSVNLFYTLNDSELERGWLEVIVACDTGISKTTTCERTISLLKMGERIVVGESGSSHLLISKLPGLGALQQNVGKLLIIDEANNLGKRTWNSLRNLRESFHGRIGTRLIVLASPNPPAHTLLDFPFGCQVLNQTLEPPDIRRFDFGVFIGKLDQPFEDIITRGRFYSSDISFLPQVLQERALIMWNLTPEQIIWQDGSLLQIETFSRELTQRFFHPEIPLVDPSDIDKKLMRISIAMAGMLGSFLNENVYITLDIIKLTRTFLETIYEAETCGLNLLSRLFEIESFGKANFEKVKNLLFRIFQSKTRFSHFIEASIPTGKFKSLEMMKVMRTDEPTARGIYVALLKEGFLKRASNFFYLTDKMKRFYAKWKRRELLEKLK